MSSETDHSWSCFSKIILFYWPQNSVIKVSKHKTHWVITWSQSNNCKNDITQVIWINVLTLVKMKGNISINHWLLQAQKVLQHLGPSIIMLKKLGPPSLASFMNNKALSNKVLKCQYLLILSEPDLFSEKNPLFLSGQSVQYLLVSKNSK